MQMVVCYFCLYLGIEIWAQENGWKRFSSSQAMQVVIQFHASKRGQSVIQEQQVNVHVLHKAKYLGTIRGQEHTMSTCVLNGSLEKSGLLCIAFPNQDRFSDE